MADAVADDTIYSGSRRLVRRFTNESDGTGESAVTKINISAFTTGDDVTTATSSTIDLIEYSVSGFNYVNVYWDHDTDDHIATLTGQGSIDLFAYGGMTDPGSTGGTGDILFTTDGGADGSAYDITIHFRPKAA